MRSDPSYLDLRNWLSLALALILMLGTVTASLNSTDTTTGAGMITTVLSDEAAQLSMGSGPGSCGVAVGVAAGIVGLALMGVTVGIGTALVLSAGLHASAILCASSKS